ncbi:MAG: CPBP family intramembrane metalloprotease [Deltaproteobacteria bacterium]|nr:CPBP family intramembrane metalloprotease [Deltaproteobacteria bacterium]
MAAYASKSDIVKSLLITVFLSFLLAAGFVPTSQRIFEIVWRLVGLDPTYWPVIGRLISFPLLAFIFWASLPSPRQEPRGKSASFLVKISVLPVLIAFLFGLISKRVSLVSLSGYSFWFVLLWYVLFVPIGEEFLFRGWFYSVLERLFKGRLLTRTNPLPISVWMTSLAFSIWHLQNLAHNYDAFVTFQLLYTLFTGLWLGYLRYMTGKLWPSIACHIVINAAVNLI